MIQIFDEFQGASLGAPEIRGNVIRAAFREEPVVDKDSIRHDYNWHFVFGVRNASPTPLEVEILLNGAEGKDLPHKASIFGALDSDAEFEPQSNVDAVTDTYKKYRLELTLGADETRFLSNTCFRSLRLLDGIFGRFPGRGFCRRDVYGMSVEGRELIAYVFSEAKGFEDGKPVFLITSGFHPMEADTFATEAVMGYLDSDEGRKLLADFHFVVIPVVNPDGFAHGFNGCNARGVNLYWDFREKDERDAPESACLWRYLQNIKPAFYVDFHAYTFQLHRKKASPYLKPLVFYKGADVQKLVRKVNAALLALHGGKAELGPLTYAPSTLGSKLTRRWNTLAYAKYHLHLFDGKIAVQAQAVEILKIAARSFQEGGFTDKGSIQSPRPRALLSRLRDGTKRALLTAWTFRFKYPLSRLRAHFRSSS